MTTTLTPSPSPSAPDEPSANPHTGAPTPASMTKGSSPDTPIDPGVSLAVADAVNATLTRRGYLTTEWWTTVLGAALTAVLALVGVHGPTAAQVVAVAAPALLAGTYAVARSLHKSQLSQIVADALPQANQAI